MIHVTIYIYVYDDYIIIIYIYIITYCLFLSYFSISISSFPSTQTNPNNQSLQLHQVPQLISNLRIRAENSIWISSVTALPEPSSQSSQRICGAQNDKGFAKRKMGNSKKVHKKFISLTKSSYFFWNPAIIFKKIYLKKWKTYPHHRNLP